MNTEPHERVIAVVSKDLLARARLEDAATRAGWELQIVGMDALSQRLGALRPAMLVLDLDSGGRDVLSAVGAARADGVLPPRLIGFVSHVDKELAAAATEAGCTVVARGKFWRDLGKLLTADG